ncbi:MAG: HAD hydrolase family protein [Proteobacteria bacterium]|nr:HAD hydrolase family protein [Pseudomonadota bacterium]
MATRQDPLHDLAQSINGIVLDVDGVLTDGKIIYGGDGSEYKHFHVQDGGSLKLLAAQGIALAIITGRRSSIVQRRAEELGIVHVSQGADDKAAALDQLIADGFPATNLCAIGDDLQDLQLFQHPAVTLAATVADAHPTVLSKAQFVTQREGGSGAIVELGELILRAQERWPFD